MGHNTAIETGTATDGADLWSKLKTFLTSKTELVSAGENWTQVWSASSDEIVLEGPGMSGTDSILIGMKYVESGSDAAEIQLSGMQGYLSGASAFDTHVNNQGKYSRLLISATLSMPYWFYATGRRFIVIVKISSVYVSCYAGMFLPYCLPSEYPLPLLVGAVANEDDGIVDWRSSDDNFDYFGRKLAWFFDPSGVWQQTADDFAESDNDSGISPFQLGERIFGLSPTPSLELRESFGSTLFGYGDIMEYLLPSFGGVYTLIPKTILVSEDRNGDGIILGDLDGLYQCPGQGASSEMLITIGSDTATVFQSTRKTSTRDYFGVLN